VLSLSSFRSSDRSINASLFYLKAPHFPSNFPTSWASIQSDSGEMKRRFQVDGDISSNFRRILAFTGQWRIAIDLWRVLYFFCLKKVSADVQEVGLHPERTGQVSHDSGG
jgi:hypothetical protein